MYLVRDLAVAAAIFLPFADATPWKYHHLKKTAQGAPNENQRVRPHEQFYHCTGERAYKLKYPPSAGDTCGVTGRLANQHLIEATFVKGNVVPSTLGCQNACIEDPMCKSFSVTLGNDRCEHYFKRIADQDHRANDIDRPRDKVFYDKSCFEKCEEKPAASEPATTIQVTEAPAKTIRVTETRVNWLTEHDTDTSLKVTEAPPTTVQLTETKVNWLTAHETETETKTETKPETKTETKTETKPETKTETKTRTETETQKKWLIKHETETKHLTEHDTVTKTTTSVERGSATTVQGPTKTITTEGPTTVVTDKVVDVTRTLTKTSAPGTTATTSSSVTGVHSSAGLAHPFQSTKVSPGYNHYHDVTRSPLIPHHPAPSSLAGATDRSTKTSSKHTTQPMVTSKPDKRQLVPQVSYSSNVTCKSMTMITEAKRNTAIASMTPYVTFTCETVYYGPQSSLPVGGVGHDAIASTTTAISHQSEPQSTFTKTVEVSEDITVVETRKAKPTSSGTDDEDFSKIPAWKEGDKVPDNWPLEFDDYSEGEPWKAKLWKRLTTLKRKNGKPIQELEHAKGVQRQQAIEGRDRRDFPPRPRTMPTMTTEGVFVQAPTETVVTKNGKVQTEVHAKLRESVEFPTYIAAGVVKPTVGMRTTTMIGTMVDNRATPVLLKRNPSTTVDARYFQNILTAAETTKPTASATRVGEMTTSRGASTKDSTKSGFLTLLRTEGNKLVVPNDKTLVERAGGAKTSASPQGTAKTSRGNGDSEKTSTLAADTPGNLSTTSAKHADPFATEQPTLTRKRPTRVEKRYLRCPDGDTVSYFKGDQWLGSQTRIGQDVIKYSEDMDYGDDDENVIVATPASCPITYPIKGIDPVKVGPRPWDIPANADAGYGYVSGYDNGYDDGYY